MINIMAIIAALLAWLASFIGLTVSESRKRRCTRERFKRREFEVIQ